MKKLHFTIGPVQSFVSQARRTRDLWAGSFLLSWLSGQAMKAVLNNKGRIIFPKVTDDENIPVDPLLKAICGTTGTAPVIGSLPNRFLAEVADRTTAEIATKAVLAAWKNMASEVYTTFVKPVEHLGNNVKAVWSNQIDRFWEIAWALGEDLTILDRRKNWRTHAHPAFHGDQCTIMANCQEISGYLRQKNRKDQIVFWESLRKNKKLNSLDLRDDERLCPAALVKRLFHVVSPSVLGWKVDVANWPGTPFMAAVPFVEKALATQPKECEEYNDLASASCDDASIHSEKKTNIACLKNYSFQANPFVGLGGEFFHLSCLQDSIARIPWLGTQNSERRHALAQKLKQLYEVVGAKPSSYYAILLMDGDRLGEKLKLAKEKAPLISKALADFTEKVPDSINKNNGVTVYAGGDDVLALLPLDNAVAAAIAVKHLYEEAFSPHLQELDIQSPCTISAGIALAHFSHPLTDIMREVHWLLEDVAKERGGRNALAVGAYKGGSLHSQWVSSWNKASLLNSFLTKLQESNRDEGILSNSFLYRLRETIKLLDEIPRRGIGEQYRVPDNLSIEALIVADLVRGWAIQEGGVKSCESACKAKEAAQTILDVCGYNEKERFFSPDGLFLARFIAQKEVS